MTKEFFINQYCRFEGPVTQMFSLLPDDKLDWSPAENTMTTRALVQHLIDSTQGMAAPRGPRWRSGEEQGTTAGRRQVGLRASADDAQPNDARAVRDGALEDCSGSGHDGGDGRGDGRVVVPDSHRQSCDAALLVSAAVGGGRRFGYAVLRDAAGTVLDSSVGDAGDLVVCWRGEAPGWRFATRSTTHLRNGSLSPRRLAAFLDVNAAQQRHANEEEQDQRKHAQAAAAGPVAHHGENQRAD